MSDSDWRAVAVAAWRDHRAQQQGDAAGEARDALQRLTHRLDLLGIEPIGPPAYGDDGAVRLCLQLPDSKARTKAVMACARERRLWLEVDADWYAGELATLADVGRALAGDDLTPLHDDAEPSVADQLLMVLRALIDDALADAMEGKL